MPKIVKETERYTIISLPCTLKYKTNTVFIQDVKIDIKIIIKMKFKEPLNHYLSERINIDSKGR